MFSFVIILIMLAMFCHINIVKKNCILVSLYVIGDIKVTKITIFLFKSFLIIPMVMASVVNTYNITFY